MLLRKVGTSSVRPIALVAALSAFALSPAYATAFKVTYQISLLGLPLGTATLDATVEPSAHYSLGLQAKLIGLAGLVTDGRGGATASGRVGDGRILPAAFAVVSRAGENKRTVRMSFSDDKVQAIDISPPLEPMPDRVPLTEAHKSGVADPLSALLMPLVKGVSAADSASCSRTLALFDGAARFDVTLTYKGTEAVDAPGYKGPALVCTARYKPIAGHRPRRKAIQFMEDNKDMDAWLVPLGETRLLVPYRISVKTLIGTAVLEATRLEKLPGKP